MTIEPTRQGGQRFLESWVSGILSAALASAAIMFTLACCTLVLVLFFGIPFTLLGIIAGVASGFIAAPFIAGACARVERERARSVGIFAGVLIWVVMGALFAILLRQIDHSASDPKPRQLGFGTAVAYPANTVAFLALCALVGAYVGESVGRTTADANRLPYEIFGSRYVRVWFFPIAALALAAVVAITSP